MNETKNYQEFYKELLRCILKSGKRDSIIHTLDRAGAHSAAHTVCTCLKGNQIGGALNILTFPSNRTVSNEFLRLVKDKFSCDKKITDTTPYSNIEEKINDQNIVGYFAYFLLKNDLVSCSKIDEILQKFSQEKVQKKFAETKRAQRNIKKLSQEKDALEKRIQQLKKKADTISSLTEKNNKLLKSNKDLQAEIDQFNQEEKSWGDNRANKTVEKTSLFLLEESRGRKYLQRVADFDGNRFIRFVSDSSREKRFDNREQFSFQMERFDGLSAGTAQIFNWFAKPKLQDPDKDEADIIFENSSKPIEIIDLHMYHSNEALQNLKNGFPWPYFLEGGQYLYVLSRQDDGSIKALFCPKGTLKYESGIIQIDSEIINLEQYLIKKEDLIVVPFSNFNSTIRTFYAKLEFEEAPKQVLLCTPLEAAAHFVREYTTETKLKNIISGRQNWQAFRSFLNTEYREPLCRRIASACGYDEKKAEECLDQFLNCSEQYLSGTDEDTQMISSLVERNPVLLQKYKAIVKEEWEKENIERLKLVSKRLTDQSVLLQSIQEECERLSEKIRSKQNELTTLQQKIDATRQLGEDTLFKVRHKIGEARKDTAGFLAELSVYFPQSETAQRTENAIFYNGQPIKNTITEKDVSTITILDVLRSNLKDAGVEENYAEAVAAWFLSAYCEGIPLLLVGPAAPQLADSVSCSVSARTAARLTCDGKWDPNMVNRAVTSNEEVLLVENPFCGKWIERLPSIALNHRKLFFFTTPFTEDLTIEPKSLYQYMLPVFTDFFICTVPNEPKIGSVWNGPFSKLSGNGKGTYLMSFLKPIGLLKAQVDRMFRRFENFLQQQADFYEFLLCMVPLAKATDHRQEAENEIQNSRQFNEGEKKYLLTLLGS